MNDCIFCKIAYKEIPSSTIYEDDLIKVFLDVNPLTNGHTLIIPKKHYTNILDVENEIINHSLNIIKEKIYPLLKNKLNCDGITVTQNNEYGQEIKHLHIHLIPRYENDSYNCEFNKEIMIPVDKVYSKLTEEI